MQDRDIEQLLESAEAPAMREGLKSEILATAAEAARPIIPAGVKWALAASFVVAVGLQMVAGGLDGAHRSVARKNPSPAWSPLETELAQEYGLRRFRTPESEAAGGRVFMNRKKTIMALLEDKKNGA